ncbi:MAG: FAD-binding protein, partial [Propionibacteriaceae bacterium]|nr:FAD-binding protein [Propionibacteriaceae bacterium]
MAAPERNWAGNLTWSAPVEHPASLAELQEVVARARRVHALGTRHSFSPCADSGGTIVALDRLDPGLVIDPDGGTATVGAGIRLGDLGRRLHEQGWAIAAWPSLQHISLGGAVATATHGSGDATGMLATLVRALDVVGPDGEVRRIAGGELAAAVMSYGTFGVATRVTVAIEPAFDVLQQSFEELAWQRVEHELDEIFAAAFSVSLFTTWVGPVRSALVKSRSREHRAGFFGAPGAPVRPPDARTTPVGTPGPAWDRLPHFRLDGTPSVGDELQSEYFVPRAHAVEALAALRAIGTDLSAALHMTELRTVAGDDLWLSPAHDTDVLAIGFT